jgi:hypothetical protein
VVIKHCPRDSNKVAHNLAKLCFELNSDFMWNGDPPNSVLIDVMNQASKYSAPHITHFNNLAWLVSTTKCERCHVVES